MKKVNIARMTMYDNMILLFDENATLIARIPAFKNGVDGFRQVVKDLKAAAKEQKSSSQGVTQAKKVQKKDLAADLATMAGAAKSYANDKGLTELATGMNVTAAKLDRLGDQDFLSTGRMLVGKARGVVGQLADYGVTAQALDELDADIDAYEKGAPAPRKAIVNRSDARDRIDELDEKASKILKGSLDGLVRQFAKTDPGFVNQYQKTRIILDGKTSGTVLTVEVQTPDARPLPAAQVRVEGTDITVTTDEKGKVVIKDIEPGIKKITVVHKDYSQKTIEEKLKPGKNNKVKAAL